MPPLPKKQAAKKQAAKKPRKPRAKKTAETADITDELADFPDLTGLIGELEAFSTALGAASEGMQAIERRTARIEKLAAKLDDDDLDEDDLDEDAPPQTEANGMSFSAAVLTWFAIIIIFLIIVS